MHRVEGLACASPSTIVGSFRAARFWMATLLGGATSANVLAIGAPTATLSATATSTVTRTPTLAPTPPPIVSDQQLIAIDAVVDVLGSGVTFSPLNIGGFDSETVSPF